MGGGPVPVQKLGTAVSIQSETLPVLHHPFQNVSCDFVSGYAFGDSIGISIQSISGWWTAREARVRNKTKVETHYLYSAKSLHRQLVGPESKPVASNNDCTLSNAYCANQHSPNRAIFQRVHTYRHRSRTNRQI